MLKLQVGGRFGGDDDYSVGCGDTLDIVFTGKG